MFNSNLKTYKNLTDVEFISRTQNKLLVVYNNEVFDLTQFQNKHPGGAAVLKEWRGKAVDNVIFNDAYFRHSRGILQKLDFYKVGQLDKNPQPDPKSQQKGTAAAAPKSGSSVTTTTAATISEQAASKKFNQNINTQQAAQISAQKQAELKREQQEKQKQIMQEQQKLEEQKKFMLQQQQKQQQQQQEQQLLLQKQIQQKQQQSQQISIDQAQGVKNNNNNSTNQNVISRNQEGSTSQRNIQQQPSQRNINNNPQGSSAQNNQSRNTGNTQQDQSNQNKNQTIEKQISIVLVEEKGSSEQGNNQQNGNTSNRNIKEEKSTPTNQNQKANNYVGKNARPSLSSERSIGRVKDFLMHAEQNMAPSLIPMVNQSSFSQRNIPMDDPTKVPDNIKEDPFDDNFDLDDIYNDEQLKQTQIPQSLEFTIFKLLKTIIS